MTAGVAPHPESSVLAARDVSKLFGTRIAVDRVSLELHSGQITALVGESGSGKTTMARLLARLYPVSSGEILLDGSPVKPRGGNRAYYGQVQMIFQDPFSSLNPLKRVRHILSRPLLIHRSVGGGRDIETRVIELLERVNLTPGRTFIDKYPTELSGGQRQRIAIARALAVEPRVLLADEPTSMLDASIRLGVLNLLKRLRVESGMAILYITHDVASARYLADDIWVMHRGRLIEGGPTERVIGSSEHQPYTQLLLDSTPNPARYKRANTGGRTP